MYNLHDSAISWLETNGFMEKTGLGWNESNIFFEESRNEKIERIKAENCSHFIDDLEEVLEEIPNDTRKILYDNMGNAKDTSKYKVVNGWNEVAKYIIDK